MPTPSPRQGPTCRRALADDAARDPRITTNGISRAHTQKGSTVSSRKRKRTVREGFRTGHPTPELTSPIVISDSASDSEEDDFCNLYVEDDESDLDYRDESLSEGEDEMDSAQDTRTFDESPEADRRPSNHTSSNPVGHVAQKAPIVGAAPPSGRQQRTRTSPLDPTLATPTRAHPVSGSDDTAHQVVTTSAQVGTMASVEGETAQRVTMTTPNSSDRQQQRNSPAASTRDPLGPLLNDTTHQLATASAQVGTTASVEEETAQRHAFSQNEFPVSSAQGGPRREREGSEGRNSTDTRVADFDAAPICPESDTESLVEIGEVSITDETRDTFREISEEPVVGELAQELREAITTATTQIKGCLETTKPPIASTCIALNQTMTNLWVDSVPYFASETEPVLGRSGGVMLSRKVRSYLRSSQNHILTFLSLAVKALEDGRIPTASGAQPDWKTTGENQLSKILEGSPCEEPMVVLGTKWSRDITDPEDRLHACGHVVASIMMLVLYLWCKGPISSSNTGRISKRTDGKRTTAQWNLMPTVKEILSVTLKLLQDRRPKGHQILHGQGYEDLSQYIDTVVTSLPSLIDNLTLLTTTVQANFEQQRTKDMQLYSKSRAIPTIEATKLWKAKHALVIARAEVYRDLFNTWLGIASPDPTASAPKRRRTTLSQEDSGMPTCLRKDLKSKGQLEHIVRLTGLDEKTRDPLYRAIHGQSTAQESTRVSHAQLSHIVAFFVNRLTDLPPYQRCNTDDTSNVMKQLLFASQKELGQLSLREIATLLHWMKHQEQCHGIKNLIPIIP